MNREQLKLHPGSRWAGDSVVDHSGDMVDLDGGLILTDNSGAYTEDVLAVIRAANLDPELNAALAEIERLSGELCAAKSRIDELNITIVGLDRIHEIPTD